MNKAVCIDLRKERQLLNEDMLSEDYFQEKVFKDVGKPVTLLFSNWRGVRQKPGPRLVLKGPNTQKYLCKSKSLDFALSRPANFTYARNFPLLFPSKRISNFTEQFVAKYLMGKEYVVVMLRTEKLSTTVLTLSSSPDSRYMQCLSRTVGDVTDLARANNVSKYVFFSDAGSTVAQRYPSLEVLRSLHAIFSKL